MSAGGAARGLLAIAALAGGVTIAAGQDRSTDQIVRFHQARVAAEIGRAHV